MKPTGAQRKIVRMDKSELAHRRSTLIPRGLELVAGAAVRKPVRVLIVDDFDETRRNLRQRVLDPDQQIVVVGEAITGADAIERYGKLRPDVVTMDINMPDMDGISATEVICRRYRDARIIMLTIQSEPDYVLRSMQAGALDYYVLPPVTEELRAAIRKLASYQPDSDERDASDSTVQSPNQTTEGMIDKTDEPSTRFARIERFIGEVITDLEGLAVIARAYDFNSSGDSLTKRLVDGANRATGKLERALEELNWPEDWDSELAGYCSGVMDRNGPRPLFLLSRSRLKYAELVLRHWPELRLPEAKYQYWLGNCISDGLTNLRAVVDWRSPGP